MVQRVGQRGAVTAAAAAAAAAEVYNMMKSGAAGPACYCAPSVLSNF